MHRVCGNDGLMRHHDAAARACSHLHLCCGACVLQHCASEPRRWCAEEVSLSCRLSCSLSCSVHHSAGFRVRGIAAAVGVMVSRRCRLQAAAAEADGRTGATRFGCSSGGSNSSVCTLTLALSPAPAELSTVLGGGSARDSVAAAWAGAFGQPRRSGRVPGRVPAAHETVAHVVRDCLPLGGTQDGDLPGDRLWRVKRRRRRQPRTSERPLPVHLRGRGIAQRERPLRRIKLGAALAKTAAAASAIGVSGWGGRVGVCRPRQWRCRRLRTTRWSGVNEPACMQVHACGPCGSWDSAVLSGCNAVRGKGAGRQECRLEVQACELGVKQTRVQFGSWPLEAPGRAAASELLMVSVFECESSLCSHRAAEAWACCRASPHVRKLRGGTSPKKQLVCGTERIGCWHKSSSWEGREQTRCRSDAHACVGCNQSTHACVSDAWMTRLHGPPGRKTWRRWWWGITCISIDIRSRAGDAGGVPMRTTALQAGHIAIAAKARHRQEGQGKHGANRR